MQLAALLLACHVAEIPAVLPGLDALKAVLGGGGDIAADLWRCVCGKEPSNGIVAPDTPAASAASKSAASKGGGIWGLFGL